MNKHCATGVCFLRDGKNFQKESFTDEAFRAKNFLAKMQSELSLNEDFKIKISAIST